MVLSCTYLPRSFENSRKSRDATVFASAELSIFIISRTVDYPFEIKDKSMIPSTRNLFDLTKAPQGNGYYLLQALPFTFSKLPLRVIPQPI